MPTIDFTSAYRDATKGSTLKALAARRAEMQAAMATARPMEVKSPEQAVGSVMQTLSGSIREGRLADQEARGRARFAELLAGGLTPDEAGEAYGLDPETTQKWMDRNWAQEDAKTAAAARDAELLRSHGWDVEKQTAEVQARKDAAAALERAQITLADHNATIEERQHAQEVVDNAGAAATKVTTDRETSDIDRTAEAGIAKTQAEQESELRMKEDKAKAETFRPLTPEDIKAWPETQTHPEDWKFNNRTGAPEPINPSQFSAAEQEKRTFDSKTKLTTVDVGLDALNRAMELAPDVTEFGEAGRTVYSPAGMLPESWTEGTPYKKTADATKRFDQIMKSNAITQMATTLAGTDSDKDVQRFIEIMADPNSTLTLKKQTISNMINRLQQERVTQAERLKSITGEDYGEYKYANPDVMTGTDTGTTAPADTAPAPDDPLGIRPKKK